MDTKLKSIKYKASTKAVAVLLAAVLFFFSGYSASMFLRDFLCYQSYVANTFTQTENFRRGFNRLENAVIQLTHSELPESVGEFAKTQEGQKIIAEKDKQIKEIENAFELLDSSGIIIYRTADNRYRYKLIYNETIFYFSYDGTLISYDDFYSYEYISHHGGERETQAAVTAVMTVVGVPQDSADVTEPVISEGETVDLPSYYPDFGDPYPDYVGNIRTALAILNSIDSYTCYGEASKEAVIAIIDESYREVLNNNYHWHLDDYYEYKNRIENTPSFKYAAINRKTGAVLTNSNVLATDSAQQILKKLGGVFAEYREKDKYVLAKGESVEPNSGFYGELKEMIDGYYTSQISYGSINSEYDYYFAYAPKADIADSLTVSERIYNSYANNMLREPTNALIVLAVSFILACAICVFLLGMAGETPDGSVKLLFFDKVPFIINLAFSLGVMALCVAGAVGMAWIELDLGWSPEMNMFDTILTTVARIISEATGLFVAIFFLVFCGLSCSIARNIRNRTFFRHTLCHYIFIPFRKLFAKMKKAFIRIKQRLTVDYTVDGKNKKFRHIAFAVIIGAVLFNALLLFLIAIDTDFVIIAVPALILFNIAVIIALCGIVVSLDRIMAGVSQIKLGKLTFNINTEYMPGFMKNFARDIESIGEGLENAVESAVRDQKMKAELITNVSHDLKTPLTSIVNYVDLLKRCEVENEDAKKYISILDEKSQRMKKLIEDLVEASKASSGAMEIHPMKIDLCELAAQTVGEHTDELKGKNIEIMLKTPQDAVYVMADAQKTSRIFENLFSNIRKYALEGTRVYFEVIEEGAVSIKNISKYPLDVPANELMRRFVRGDASRSGEGSGLGLSIAQNLCELQGGRFGVYIDGDLFKVTVELPLA